MVKMLKTEIATAPVNEKFSEFDLDAPSVQENLKDKDFAEGIQYLWNLENEE